MNVRSRVERKCDGVRGRVRKLDSEGVCVMVSWDDWSFSWYDIDDLRELDEDDDE